MHSLLSSTYEKDVDLQGAFFAEEGHTVCGAPGAGVGWGARVTEWEPGGVYACEHPSNPQRTGISMILSRSTSATTWNWCRHLVLLHSNVFFHSNIFI